ncbi:hypothetical protein CZ771_01555 [Actinomycetales bacterium JB111]|nr:hypothetical protein CZ771_01555 [Actinomycetales bacterium JB111]
MRTTTRSRSITGAVAAAVLALGLTACGDDAETETTDGGSETTSSDTPADPESGGDSSSDSADDAGPSVGDDETGSDDADTTIPPSDGVETSTEDSQPDDADTGDLVTEIPEDAMVSVVYMYSEGGANRADVITAASGTLMFQSGDPAQAEPEEEQETELSDADWESLRAEIVDLGIPTASGQPDPSLTDPTDPSNFEGTYFWMIGGQTSEPLAFAGDDANLNQALWEIVESYS